MSTDITIDRESDIPVYRQIIEKITSLVSSGGMKPGDKLPPERELALQLGIARGPLLKRMRNWCGAGFSKSPRGGGVSCRRARISFLAAEKNGPSNSSIPS